MIELERVTKAFADRTVVDDVSLTIGEGELWALIGPSGSGKSTTLRLINRLIAFDSGSIRIEGESISTLPVEALRRRIGYAIQSVGLFPHWTVADNVATVPRLLKWPRARVEARVAELLELLRLDPDIYSGRYPHQLSGGEQQRVGVARALAADPDLLLMDEPFGALDPITREALQSELVRIHRLTRKTILIVTHDMDEALRMADHIAVLQAGRLVQAGTPREIVETPVDDFVSGFVGNARRGLAALSLRTVADKLRPGGIIDGSPIPIDASLADALSEMTLRRVDRLAVAARDGSLAGVIHLADIVA